MFYLPKYINKSYLEFVINNFFLFYCEKLLFKLYFSYPGSNIGNFYKI
jgi:hypothetical protein